MEVKGSNYIAINNDCVEEVKSWPTDSIDLYVTSIPFGNHYEYSPSYNDFGHNPNDDEFFKQMDSEAGPRGCDSCQRSRGVRQCHRAGRAYN